MLPLGAIGEIGIGGMGVAKGYINKPSLTSEKFITIDGIGVVYKTGDHGRFLKDGNIELFGRIDNQIKIRGYRIEPAEIEILLNALEGINESVVKIHKFEENDERLVAYLQVSDDFDIKPREISDILKQKLPLYMIPSIYKIMRELPRTNNGKIDRKALVVNTKEEGGKEGVAEKMTPTEKTIHKIWCDILHTENIVVTDNFFEIGGNSLLAISVFSKIQAALNIQLGLRVFFDSPRIRDLAEVIDIESRTAVESTSNDNNIKTDSIIVNGEL
jgi:hypothetical protein